MAKSNAKFMTGLSPVMPVADAASVVLQTRLRAVAKLLPAAAAVKSEKRSEDAEKAIHALRVSARRAAAAIGVFRPLLGRDEFRKARKRLRDVRRAAGLARDCDVQLGVLKRAAASARQAHQKSALKHLAAQTRAIRKTAQTPLREVLEEHPPETLRKLCDKVVGSIGRKEPKDGAFAGESRLIDAARAVLEREIESVLEASHGDLTDLERVHELRIELKRLRYGMEVFGSCFGRTFRDRLYPELIAIQECLGTVNDAHVLIKRVEQEVERAESNAELRKGLRAVLAEQRETLESAHAAFLETWKRFQSGGFFDDLRRELADLPPAGAASGGPGIGGRIAPFTSAMVEPKPHGQNGAVNVNGTHPRSASAAVSSATPGGGGAKGARRRVAAVDVGTNSVRLIVAESSPDGSYRILDDEKEITRLGRGLHETGKMNPESMEHTAVTIARMKSIALGYGAEELRVVGTAAAREAKNAATLRKLLRDRAGLEMEVISGEEEAMLAYRSAARAFDLSRQSGLVVDVGGGSTEMVLSAGTVPGAPRNEGGRSHDRAEGAGVIDAVYTVPIGAVRLTEMFGGPEKCAGSRYEEMREYVRDLLKKHVGRAPMTPQVVIGTGGTLTTLAAMALNRELGGSAEGLFGKVQGTEVSRAEIKHLLEYLRKLPIRERTRVPGLSADRADIIIAGLVIVDAVLKRFDVNRLKVHEGGIRDGLLLSMVRRSERTAKVGEPAPGDVGDRPDPMKSVKRFAKDCGYEQAHARHVTRLSLRIFDQLAAQRSRFRIEEGMRFDADARMLLEAAALLHDIGYLINYAQHHKHSYHLIVHADLPGLTTSQMHVVANVARYHRSAEPKARHRNFAMLSPEDRAMVRGLAGILRVADGLDRTHMQNVRDVHVKLEKGAAFFAVQSRDEPAVDIWGAVRKSELFRAAFALLPHIEWRRSDSESGSGDPVAAGKGVELWESPRTTRRGSGVRQN